MRIGALEETLTVTGVSPVVDVQSSQTVRTLGSEYEDWISESRPETTFPVVQEWDPFVEEQG